MISPTIRSKASENAFTLVEMLLVVTIIGVLVAVAMPRYAGSFGFMKLRSGAYDVAATVEYAQSMSILQERTLRFSVSDDGRRCWISEEDPSVDRKAFPTTTCELPDGVEIKGIDFTDPLAGGGSYVEFHPDGDCEPCAIRVIARSGEAYDVFVTRGMGHARVARAKEEVGWL